MKNYKIIVPTICIYVLVTLIQSSVLAGGISIDAGLTPPVDRWMVRTQVRFSERNNHPVMTGNQMKMYMHPIVVAYGLRSDLTLMMRQVIRSKEMTMGTATTKNSGFADLFFMAKYRLVRKNTRNYSIGLAPTLGIDIPTGEDGFSSNSYNLHMGIFGTLENRKFGLDINSKYIWNSISKANGSLVNHGNEIEIKSAISFKKSFGENADYSLSPVVETSYNNIASSKLADNEIANTGEWFFYISPGLKFTYTSLIIEGLYQFPVSQNQNGLQTERDNGFIFGVRIMF